VSARWKGGRRWYTDGGRLSQGDSRGSESVNTSGRAGVRDRRWHHNNNLGRGAGRRSGSRGHNNAARRRWRGRREVQSRLTEVAAVDGSAAALGAVIDLLPLQTMEKLVAVSVAEVASANGASKSRSSGDRES
jgi:ribosomal protein L15